MKTIGGSLHNCMKAPYIHRGRIRIWSRWRWRGRSYIVLPFVSSSRRLWQFAFFFRVILFVSLNLWRSRIRNHMLWQYNWDRCFKGPWWRNRYDSGRWHPRRWKTHAVVLKHHSEILNQLKRHLHCRLLATSRLLRGMKRIIVFVIFFFILIVLIFYVKIRNITGRSIRTIILKIL